MKKSNHEYCLTKHKMFEYLQTKNNSGTIMFPEITEAHLIG